MKQKRLAVSVVSFGFVLVLIGFIGLKLGSVQKKTDFMVAWNSIYTPFLYTGIVFIIGGMIWGNCICGQKREKWVPYLLITPTIIALLLFVVYPIINVIYLSFFKGNALKPTKEFVGVTNYISMFEKPAFRSATRNTFVYAFIFVLLTIAISLLMAAWLFDSRPINKLSQTVIFTPQLIATVSCAFIWRWVFDHNSYGLLNTFLSIFGIDPIPWLESSKYALGCIIAMNVWRNLGYYTLIFIAAMKSVPEEIYDAAKLDGATGKKCFIKITLPLISPQIFFSLVMLTISSFNVFDSINAMTAGGPGTSTEVIARYIYMFAFQNTNTLGLGCSAAVFLMCIQMFMTLLYFRLLEKRIHYQ